MTAWTVAVVDGIVTGLILYGLVRLRMKFGPIAAQRWGVWGRRAVWAVLIAAMVIVAETDLIWLRGHLQQTDESLPTWHYEATYAAVLLTVGMLLVFGRILSRRAKKNANGTQAREPN